MGVSGIRLTCILFVVVSLLVGCVPPERNMRLQWLIKQKKKKAGFEELAPDKLSPDQPPESQQKAKGPLAQKRQVEPKPPKAPRLKQPLKAKAAGSSAKPTARPATTFATTPPGQRTFAKDIPPPPVLKPKAAKKRLVKETPKAAPVKTNPAKSTSATKAKPIVVDQSQRKIHFKKKPSLVAVPKAATTIPVGPTPVGPKPLVVARQVTTKPVTQKKQRRKTKQAGLLTPAMLRGKGVKKVTLVDADAPVETAPKQPPKAKTPKDSVYQTNQKPKTEIWAELPIIAPKYAMRLRPEGGAKKFYSRAFASFSKGDYGGSNQLFGVYLKKYPQDSNADNAQFWIGLGLYKQGFLNEAEEAFQKVLNRYEHGPTNRGYKTPDSILMLARIQKSKGLNLKARYYYKKLIELYPKSRSGVKAKKELSQL